MRMPDATELTLFGIIAALFLAYLASWPIEWWLDRRRKRITARLQALDTYMAAAPQLDALAESPALMEAVRSTPEPPACGEMWRNEVGCYRGRDSHVRPHACVLIGGHRIHRCVCGVAWVIGDPPLAPTFDPDDVYGLPEDRPPLEPKPTPAPGTRPYTTDGMVKLGRNTLCRSCLDHRTNGRYAEICDSCRPSLVGSASKLPS